LRQEYREKDEHHERLQNDEVAGNADRDLDLEKRLGNAIPDKAANGLAFGWGRDPSPWLKSLMSSRNALTERSPTQTR
jgi:hypothetical protein